MWPFKSNSKKNKDTKDETNIENLIAVRYTYDAFQKIYPYGTKEQWESVNYPNDILAFVKQQIKTMINTLYVNMQNIQIATINNHYIEWAINMGYIDFKGHINEYINLHKDDCNFWDDRLKESGMTQCYHVMGIPSPFIIPEDKRKTEYFLSDEKTEELTEKLKEIYECQDIFVPGWITKGSDMPHYINDIIQIAEETWKTGKKIRFLKYMEQNYNTKELENKNIPLYFVIPFLIKTNQSNSKINLCNLKDKDNINKQDVTSKMFSSIQRCQLLKIIRQSVGSVITIGNCAVIPGQAYLSYNCSLNKNKNTSNIIIKF